METKALREQMKNATTFDEAQRVGPLWVRVLGLALPLPFWVNAATQLLWDRPMGSNPVPDGVMVFFWVLFGVLVSWFILASRLETTVEAEALRVHFPPYPYLEERFELSDIVRREVVRVRPLKDYGGWGLRHSSKGRAWIAQGTEGIQFTLRGGERVFIGSRRSDELAAVLDVLETEAVAEPSSPSPETR